MCSILLELKLTPSVTASRYILFKVLRFLLAALCLFTLFFVSPIWFYVSAAAWVVLTCLYFMYLYRLVLCILLLAQKAEGAGQPVGRPSPSNADILPQGDARGA